MAIASLLASMANWSTPTVLFCVLNLMIATIFVASNFKSPNRHHQNMPGQLARSPSLLERVRNFSSYYDYQAGKVGSETTESNSKSQLIHRPPSLLERVRSIDFSFSSFHNSLPVESEISDQRSGGSSSSKDETSDIDPHQDSHEDNISETPAPSGLLVAASDCGEEESDGRRWAEMKAGVGVHDGSVDAKADDFIKKFKQRLKLQRLDSLQRLREMLNRGI